jgi:hypothetical protein
MVNSNNGPEYFGFLNRDAPRLISYTYFSASTDKDQFPSYNIYSVLMSFRIFLQQLSYKSNNLKAFSEFIALQKATKEKVPALQVKVDYMKSLFEVHVIANHFYFAHGAYTDASRCKFG